jgi:hypothetical protein
VDKGGSVFQPVINKNEYFLFYRERAYDSMISKCRKKQSLYIHCFMHAEPMTQLKTNHKIKKTVLPVLLAAIWISISEFVRNEFLVKSYWTSHYEKLGLVFPSQPVNGAVWGLWSLCFAVAIFIIAKKFSLLQTTLLSWFAGFVLMWIVLWNMSVLPAGLLLIAVPLSLLEAFLASFIIKKLTGTTV